MFEEFDKLCNEALTEFAILKSKMQNTQMEFYLMNYCVDKEKYIKYIEEYDGDVIKLISKIWHYDLPHEEYKVGKIESLDDIKKELEQIANTIFGSLGMTEIPQEYKDTSESLLKSLLKDEQQDKEKLFSISQKILGETYKYLVKKMNVEKIRMLFFTFEHLKMSELDKYDISLFLVSESSVCLQRFLKLYSLSDEYWSQFKRRIF